MTNNVWERAEERIELDGNSLYAAREAGKDIKRSEDGRADRPFDVKLFAVQKWILARRSVVSGDVARDEIALRYDESTKK